jgi:uncharacterized protein
VWGGDDPDSDAPFASGKQKKRAIVLVLRHLRAIDQALQHHPDRWEPVFSVAEDGDREYADAEDWCIGFLQATAMDSDGWGRLFDDPELGPLPCCPSRCWAATTASWHRPMPNAWPTPATATN